MAIYSKKQLAKSSYVGGLNFSYLSSSAVVVCMEGSDDVLSTPCTSSKWVGWGVHLVSETWWLLSRDWGRRTVQFCEAHAGGCHLKSHGICRIIGGVISIYLFILVQIYQPVTSCRDWYECCRLVLKIMFIMFVEKPLSSGFAVYKLGHCHHIFLSAVTVLVSLTVLCVEHTSPAFLWGWQHCNLVNEW
jgi:hypothetical protein